MEQRIILIEIIVCAMLVSIMRERQVLSSIQYTLPSITRISGLHRVRIMDIKSILIGLDYMIKTKSMGIGRFLTIQRKIM